MRSKAAPQKVYFSGRKLLREAVKPCACLKGLSGMGLPRAGKLSPSLRRLLAARDAFSSLQTHEPACSGPRCEGCTAHRRSDLAATGATACMPLLQVLQLCRASSFLPWLAVINASEAPEDGAIGSQPLTFLRAFNTYRGCAHRGCRSGSALEALLMSMRATSARYSGDSLFRISSTLWASPALETPEAMPWKGVPPPSLSGAAAAAALLFEERICSRAFGTAATTCCAFANCSAAAASCASG